MTKFELVILAGVTAVTVSILGCRPTTSWDLALSNDGTEDWSINWYLEGDKASVENGEDGFVLSAGPTPGEDASHAVLWTRRSFAGDVKIEFEYTRLDTMTSVDAVNIVYLQATGLGSEAAPEDIAKSAESRRVPTMSKYYLNMNALQVSFATSGPGRSNYVSARRYPATSVAAFPTETQLQPVYENVNLFEPGVTYQISVIKTDEMLSLSVVGAAENQEFVWGTTRLPALSDGRIGLRHMWARSARYSDVRVYVRNKRAN